MDAKLSSLKTMLADLVGASRTISLWLSGGSDSRLLLEVMQAEGLQFTVLNFSDAMSRNQRKTVDQIITKHNLQVFSYPAREHFLISRERKLSLISLYAAGRGAVPMVRDIVTGEKCAFDLSLDASRHRDAPIAFDAHIVGTRARDSHWSTGRIAKQQEWSIGDTKFYAPLHRWTRREVKEALALYGTECQKPAERLDTGNVACCHRCLVASENETVFCPKANKEISAVRWDKEGNLALFRNSIINKEQPNGD